MSQFHVNLIDVKTFELSALSSKTFSSRKLLQGFTGWIKICHKVSSDICECGLFFSRDISFISHFAMGRETDIM